MKIKAFVSIILLSLLSCTAAWAQALGGIDGKVISRTSREAISGVNITLQPGGVKTTSDDTGAFSYSNLKEGEYSVTFENSSYETLTLIIRIDGKVRPMQAVLIPLGVSAMTVDEDVFADYANETLDDAQSVPSSLSASKDLFNNIASYKFSEMRFNVRGYDSKYTDLSMNGIRLNDAMTGYTPWSLWSGLNDVTRTQTVTNGSIMSENSVGGIGGTIDINTSPSQMRRGLRVSLVSTNQSYAFRGMVTYASGAQDNGWSYAFSFSTRQGGNSYVDGMFYNAYSYFGTVEKKFGERHRLQLSILGAPTERGAQAAATQEAYDLVGNNYYNPNWGYLNGKKVNARVRDYHEPLTMLNYTFKMDERNKLDLAASYRFGKNGYSALSWYGGPDPRPDYYRYLPSFYGATSMGAQLYEAWMANTDDIRYINWDNLYNINRNQPEDDTYTPGKRSINIVEERHTDQRDWNFNAQYSHLFKNNSKILAGATLRYNRTEYYSQIKDLLGGDYWIDIDKFAERDMGGMNPVQYQNNMDYYDKYGYAPAARVGDKYSYDYYAKLVKGRAWIQYETHLGNLDITLGAEGGRDFVWRDGIWKKGLFLNNSQGDSETQKFWTARVKANFSYRFSAAQSISANVLYMQDAPQFKDMFLSPRTRNEVTPNLKTEKTFSFDASYMLRLGDFKARVSGYYTRTKDQMKVVSYYDDTESTFSNFAMSGIAKKYFGLEAAVSVPLFVTGLSLEGAVSWGQYTYDNNPNYVQVQDNSGIIKNEGKVYWKNMRIESSPQLALNVGLNYRGPKNIYASVDVNYYDQNYISMSPLYRTDAVLTPGMTQDDIEYLRRQEKFAPGCVVNASIGKNWYVDNYTIGISLQGRNLLNRQNIKTGGYEQIRLLKNKDESMLTYQPFDSKYYYMFGTTYYLNVYFRF
jgi:hypothetical protein